MATIVNSTSPQQPTSSGSGMGFILGVILLIVFLLALLYYGLPMLNRATQAPQVNVPEQVDVNVNQPAGQPSQ